MTRFGALAVPEVTGPMEPPPIGSQWYYSDSHTCATVVVIGVDDEGVRLRSLKTASSFLDRHFDVGRMRFVGPRSFRVGLDWFRANLVRDA